MAVVELRDQNGGCHTVRVDCTSNPKIIWDCQEKHGLVLTKQNLDHCCGPQCECIAITNIATIVKKKEAKNDDIEECIVIMRSMWLWVVES